MIDTRSAILIFRDCLKIVPKMVEQNNRVLAVRGLIRNQFQRHRHISDPAQISSLKMNAAKGISNYLIYTIQQDMKMNPNRNYAFEPQSEEEEYQECQQSGEEMGQGEKEGKEGKEGKGEGEGDNMK